MEPADKAIKPDEIRAIRKSLSLSQVEAGELLGGGPRAFTKYEAGTVSPSAAVISLLRVLEKSPATLALLTGAEPRTPLAADVLPLEVSGQHIALLTDRSFPLLLGKLLSAEAQAYGLPEYGIHVASNIDAPDGGEDGRIRWTEGPSHTSFLPSRFCQFQVKAGKISPADSARDVVSGKGEIKPMVRSAIQEHGHYIMLCAHPYTQQQLETRKERIRMALRNGGMTIDDSRVDFRDADQVAAWVNRYPSVAAWVKELTQPGAVGPFRSWIQWASRSEHDTSPLADDDRLASLSEPIKERVAEPRRVVRVVGPSGIGKSRLVLELLKPSEHEESLGFSLADLVLYADESEMGDTAINGVVQTLAENQQRAVVVVDRCRPETHRTLVGMVQRRTSLLSLITIDDDIPAAVRNQETVELSDHEIVVNVPEAPSSVTENIINSVCPGLPSEDFRRLAHFSKGFPKVAHLVAQSWISERPVAHCTDDHLVETFVVGRRAHDQKLLIGSAQLIAAFFLVRAEDQDGGQLSQVAARGQNLSATDLRECCNKLIDRGVVRRRGGYVTLEPLPIALHLAEQKWRGWSPGDWDAILGGDTSPDLKANAAKQLALLNTTEIAQRVVNHVCRTGGPFDGVEGLQQPRHTEVLSSLAEIETSVVAKQIEHSLRQFSDLEMVGGDVRRHLVWALEKIAFNPDSFDVGASLLLRLALAENESIGNNATGQFVGLFPVILGNTAADGRTRLLLLAELAVSDNHLQRQIVVDALVNASATHHFSRMVGSETHGTRPALSSWHPVTRDAVLEYIQNCADLLVVFATGLDEAAEAARVGLGRNLASWISRGFIDLVETVVHAVAAKRDSWPEALEALDGFLRREAFTAGPEVAGRVRALREELEPRSLDARIRLLVTEMPWEYLSEEELDYEQLYLRQVGVVREFAAELLEEPETVRGLLPSLCRQLAPRDGRHPQRMLFPFGQAIVDFAESPLDWLDPIIAAINDIPPIERDFDLLSGYLVGISKSYPEEVKRFKRRAAGSDVLAPALPLVCWRLQIVASDIKLVLSALQAGLLSPWLLKYWASGGVLAKVEARAVAPLFDTLLEHGNEGYTVALELLGMYAFQRMGTLEHFRPQLRKVAENFARYRRTHHHTMSAHYFGNIMKWMLENGRDDSDARAVALALAQALVKPEDNTVEDMIRPVIGLLLKDFPEIVWPVLGNAAISDGISALRLSNLLGSRMSSVDQRQDAAILSLPEDVLFEWCRAHPDSAPAFAATVVPILSSYEREAEEHTLNSCMARLIDEYSDQEDVLQAIGGNIISYFGWGSPTEYYALYEQPLSILRDEHPAAKVRRWAGSTLREIDAVSERFRSEDDEWSARNEV
ncbi:MAG: hypothetical protein F4Z71_09725 [Gammaproteobacteria bacterium]|nr:hypothetical protein [Gammaproteobacteria bacterium]MYE29900.1 hypothetical protein [Gammaproteobacteria bacterium]